MARWKLTSKHYLKVPGTVWEYREVGNTGRQKAQVHPVPLYLDPDDNADCNYDGDRFNPPYIVVCYEGRGLPADIVFEGSPTPDMEPLDDEAEAITAAERPKWIKPMDVVNVGDFGANLVEAMIKQMGAVQAGQPIPSAPGEVTALQRELAAAAVERAELQEELARIRETAISPEIAAAAAAAGTAPDAVRRL